MMALSPEMNRLLGQALLDPELMKRLLSAERAKALREYGLLPQELGAVMASRASTLPELSREVCAACATPVVDPEAQVQALYQSVPLPTRQVYSRQLQGMIQRAIGDTPAVDVADEYARLKSA